MKKSLIALFLGVMLASATAFAGGSLSGYGTVKLEACDADNLLILSEENQNTFNWPYRVEEPSHCIHIYPDETEVYPDYYPDGHEFYYTLPAEARIATGYYDEIDYLDKLDRFEDGDKIHYQFSITGGTSNKFLITDVLEDNLIFVEVEEVEIVEPIELPVPDPIVIPPAGFEDEVITAFEVYENPFSDTDMTTLEGMAAAELYRRAVLGGYPDGEFKGYRDVNRAEGAKFLLLARYGKVADVAGNGGFPDVLEGEWYTKFVVTAAQKGIINGYPNGLFMPADTINTAEFLKMLSKTFDLKENLPYSYLDVDKDQWYAVYTGIAQHYNLFPKRSSYLKPEKDLTRDEVAVAIYQYLINRDVEVPPIEETPEPPEAVPVAYTPHSTGNADAEVTIEVWGGLDEPFTRKLKESLDDIMENFPSDVRLVWRHFPLTFHKEAYPAGNAAECAAAQQEDSFWNYISEIFSEDREMLGHKFYLAAADSLDLDLLEFNACIEEQSYYGHVKYDSEKAYANGITGSPTMYVNGEILQGAQPYSVIKDAVLDALEDL